MSSGEKEVKLLSLGSPADPDAEREIGVLLCDPSAIRLIDSQSDCVEEPEEYE